MLRRLIGLLIAPRAEWARIAAEPRGAAAVLVGWVLPLALVPFGAILLRFLLMTSILGARAGFALAPYVLADAAAQYAFIVAWMIVVSMVANALAPRFEGQRNFSRALRVVAYALTPAFLASVVVAVPIAQYLAALGLVWAVLLLRLGLPPLMGSPERRATAYAVTVAVIATLLALLVLLMPSCTQYAPAGEGNGVAVVLVPARGAAATLSGKGNGITSPDETIVGVDKKGSGSINLDDLSKESIGEMIDRTVDRKTMHELEEAAKLAAESVGKIPFKPAEPSMLGDLMPATVCDLPRASLESKLGTLPKQQMADAQAMFTQPGSGVQVHLTVGDNTTLVWGMVQLRKLQPNHSQTTARGYQRRRSEGDAYIDDRWDAPRRESYFVVLIANRFVVSAKATGVDTPGCAEQAARSVDWAKLAAMADAPVR